ncbi:IS1634 family transposase [Pectinatus frisingensis]|uniref:IS1634 family transposase n=1 Tax=Pectinatus frisingensis TaxID=865 RepID=UPI0018C6CE44|nr:IS1634 family transposase [Pectinatus frisingensis]
MRLQISTSKNSKSLYVIRSIYENGRHSSKVVEKLGTYDQLLKQLNGEDPIAWAKKYVDELNKQEKIDQHAVLVKYSPVKRITKDEQNVFNGGYLFLQKIYFSLGLHETCKQIVNKYKFTFNMDSILSRLIYSRILFPSSKLETLNLSKRFIEQPDFDLQHIYRALSIIAKESEFIQTQLYKNSQRICKRNTNILYYDCTNYFFEIGQEAGLKQYGPSKEHRPNPIVQMGLFMDGDGIPLAFNINKGNTNEQVTLTPLEEKILKDFEISKFVVCTDAGLASTSNRKFNNNRNRAFITTQSIKKLKKPLREWALDETGWRIYGSSRRYNLNSLADSGDKSLKNQTFYKERWIREDTLEQKLIVTYSLKYRDYQRQIRKNQIERAMKMIDDNPQRIHKCSQNDFKRLIAKKSITSDGEIADKNLYSIDADLIAKEEVFDGFYGVCTNLEDDASAIIKINHQRWKIEESFRIMKTEFKARPVYLSRDDRISAHFTTCFIALTLYRLLERQLNERFTNREIIQGLQNMNFYKVAGEGYIPAYTRNDFTDALHETFKFQTDYQIVNTHQMKNIFKATKS